MVRLIFAGILIVHGLAHISGFLAIWTKVDEGYKLNEPWIFSKKVFLKSSLGKIFGILWLFSLVLLTSAGLSIFFHFYDWEVLAVMGVCISFAVILPWWKTVPFGAKLGAGFSFLILLYVFLSRFLPNWVDAS